ncbi:hypothetical protein ACLB2K_074315 [Fragaria x ananassa]
MNPKKCWFGVSSAKFLGFVVHSRSIDVDPSKFQAIASLPPPENQKGLKSFLGKLSYIRHFIPGSAAVIKTFAPLLKKENRFTGMLSAKKLMRRYNNLSPNFQP